ncbi:AbrB/MazE/SpoVT family DNA-binding domain-containing protein [Paracraurococcus ruber]|uniref:AbrB/MazE/SpoVT family DNA-binding domain-containing protein n=1 Tax=Paracraurococcus ruber TaxID=77675 RepID=UPI001305338B|nr:AbrB/MazE/SpoVT family DNA-binding domain-containing protein [Paracraurococcus ruber]
MSNDGSGEGGARAYLRTEVEVRREFEAASYAIWIGLARLLGRRVDQISLAHAHVSSKVRELSDLARLRCLPDGLPLPAAAVLDALNRDVMQNGKTPERVVERIVVRELVGEPRTSRTPKEITALIHAFLRCYAADYERGEVTWIDELYTMVVPDAPRMSWVLDIPFVGRKEGDETVTVQIPAAALKAAGLHTGDRLILEPRSDGLWLGKAPDRSPRPGEHE